MGCLKNKPGGEKEFVSLLDQLPAEAREPKSIRCLYATPDGMIFAAGHQVIRWRDGHFKVWPFPKQGRLISACAGGKLCVHQSEFSVFRLAYARPDIILLDVSMPGIDGYETCRRLKADARWRDTPVFFLTALSGPVEKVHGFEVGAVDYITKPLHRRRCSCGCGPICKSGG